MEDVRVLDDAPTAALVLDPVRRDLLARLRTPGSAASLAAASGMSRQRIRHFLRSLEDHALIVQIGERRWGGIVERLMIAVAASYVVSTEALGEVGASPRVVSDRLSAQYLISLAAQAVRDVAALSRRAAQQQRRVATLSLDTTLRFASAKERAAFTDELTATVRALTARYDTPEAPDGRDHHVVVLAYPTIEEPAR